MQRTWCALLALAIAACGSDKMVGSSTVTGTYTLRSVNGSSPPYTLPGGGAGTIAILDDAYILYEGGTFTETAHYRVTRSAQVTDSTKTWTGTYGLLGTSVTFRVNETGANVIAAMHANDLTIVENGVTSVYRK